jgi:hypothetical protein
MNGSSASAHRVWRITSSVSLPHWANRQRPSSTRARSADGERLLKEATDGARKLGIFCAPTFAIGSEIYWGDDRLADALSFASGR